MQTEIRMVVALIDRVYADPRVVAETHRPIARAVGQRDEQAAAAALRFHIEDAHTHLRAVFMQKRGTAPIPQGARP